MQEEGSDPYAIRQIEMLKETFRPIVPKTPGPPIFTFSRRWAKIAKWSFHGSELQALVEPHDPKAGNGRRPVGLAIMLRTYFMQQWFNWSDPGVEEAFYESAPLRWFAGVDLGVAPAPDETTLPRFRHLLEKHDLGGAMLDAVNLHLAAKPVQKLLIALRMRMFRRFALSLDSRSDGTPRYG